MKHEENYPMALSRSVDLNNLRFCFKDREKRSNKGDFGRILFICGSYPDGDGYAMSGAVTLSAKAALRTGSGLVEICTHKGNFSPVSANLPEAVMLIYENEIDTESLINAIKKADAVVVGCGLGKSEGAKKLLVTVLESTACPLVIDADALNILSEHPSLWELLGESRRAQTVITPHMMEMSRLCGRPIKEILEMTAETAWGFSQKYGVVTLLKDNKTVVTNGRTMYVNTTGNAGMSTAGAGDVLAGILGSMLGNDTLGCSSLVEKVAIGAYLHGLAGDIARERYGEHSLIASDIVDSIPEAICSATVGRVRADSKQGVENDIESDINIEE